MRNCRLRMPLPEFVAMMALLFAGIAFSMDALLPALPEITSTLAPDAPNQSQLVLTVFVLGMGFGTFVAGPISDATGARPRSRPASWSTPSARCFR